MTSVDHRHTGSARHSHRVTVLPSSEARSVLPTALSRFRRDGALSEPVVFGSHRKPEAVVIPFELYEALAPFIEDLEIAEQVRERSAAGPAEPLADIAADMGLDPDKYR